MRRILTIALILCSGVMFGQHLFNASQGYLNRNLINPAFAGADKYFSASMWYRNQWAGIKGAPETFHLQMNGPLRNEHVGVGAVLTNDRIGVSNRYTFMLQYSYKVRLHRKGFIRAGLSGGFLHWSRDWGKILANDPDANFAGDVQRVWSPEVYAGIGYEYKELEIGISAPLVYSNAVLNAGGRTTSYQHYVLYGKYSIPLDMKWSMDPMFVFKYMAASGSQADFNIRFNPPENFFFGVGYRTNESLSLFVGAKITDNWEFSYQYDLLTSLYKYSSGSHEFGLKYNFRYKIRALDMRMF